MVFIVYSVEDTVSLSAAEAMKELFPFKEAEEIRRLRHFKYKHVDMLELKTHHLHSEYLDEYIKTDLIIFLSRHTSNKGIPAFTVHPEGNWSSDTSIGGKPNQLATAAPVDMLKILVALNKDNNTGVSVTYEATHHGPFLKTPSLYAEIGGNSEIWKRKDLASFLSNAVVNSLDDKPHYDKVAIGVGGLHYADRYAKLALEGKYAFGHMMSRHYVKEYEMLGQAVERSKEKPEIAVIEWKSMNGEDRGNAIKKLNELGLDYAKI